MEMNHFKETFNKLPAEKRKKILEVAIEEFSEHGFEGTNINSVSYKAGISVGSIYKYFENKEDLFLTVVHYGVETLKAILYEIMEKNEDLEGKIEKIIRAIQLHSRNNIYLTRFYNEMATESHSDLVWKIASDMENATAGFYASFIGEAQNSGQIKSDINANMFAFYLDNLFVMLQFSYACEYYKERMKIYIGEDVFERDEQIVEQLMKFIRGAFFLK